MMCISDNTECPHVDANVDANADANVDANVTGEGTDVSVNPTCQPGAGRPFPDCTAAAKLSPEGTIRRSW